MRFIQNYLKQNLTIKNISFKVKIYLTFIFEIILTDVNLNHQFDQFLTQPTPRVTWRRDDGNPIILRSNQSNSVERRKETFVGNILTLYNTSRKQMGAYLCIATNGVPAAVSKRVYLSVQCKNS